MGLVFTARVIDVWRFHRLPIDGGPLFAPQRVNERLQGAIL